MSTKEWPDIAGGDASPVVSEVLDTQDDGTTATPSFAQGNSTRTAPPPFAHNPSADIVLRTSDDIEFHVVKAILTMASPAVWDVLKLGTPTSTSSRPASPISEASWAADADEAIPTKAKTDVPRVYDVPEDHGTLDTLLRFCYPIHNPVLTDLAHTIRVLEASRRYQIDVAQAACEAFLRGEAATKPMAVYLIACKYGLEGLARAAAQETMNVSEDELLRCDRLEVEEVNFGCVQRLLKFRAACQEAVLNETSLRLSAPWATAAQQSGFADKPCCADGVPGPVRSKDDSAGGASSTEATVKGRMEAIKANVVNQAVVRGDAARWRVKYMKEMRKSLENLHKDGREHINEAVILNDAVIVAASCVHCRPTALFECRAFEQRLQKELRNAMEKVAGQRSFVTASVNALHEPPAPVFPDKSNNNATVSSHGPPKDSGKESRAERRQSRRKSTPTATAVATGVARFW